MMRKPAKMFYSICSGCSDRENCSRCKQGVWHEPSEREYAMLETYDFLYNQCKHCGAIVDQASKQEFCPLCERELD